MCEACNYLLTGIVRSAKNLPQHSGWEIEGTHVAAVNLTTTSLHNVPGDELLSGDFIGQARTNPDYYGILFVLNITRVTR